MKKLYLIDGPNKGTCFTLNDGITTVGRSSDNDICISDKGASWHHARFLKKDDKIFVAALSGSGGVFIDGEKIEPGKEVEIKKGGNLRIGNSMLSFQKELSGKEVAQPNPTSAQRESLLDKDSSRIYTRSLELLLKVSNILAQSLNMDELLNQVIDQIFDLLKRIDRGAILLLDKETGTLTEVVSKTRTEDKEGVFSKINYSRTIVRRAIREAEPVMMSDTSLVDKVELSDSMEQMNIRSVMCVPLKYKGEVRGVIYVDSIRLPNGFRKDDLQLLDGLGNTAAVAIENAQLYSNLEKLVERRTEQLEKIQDTLRQNESRFRAVFENMNIGVAIFQASDKGKDFIYKDLNKAAEKIDKITKDDVIGKSVLAVFPRFKDSGLFDILKRVWKTGKPEYHSPMLYRDDRITSWRCHYGYRLSSGEVAFIYEDVTAQKQAIEDQQKLQKQLSHAQKMESLGRLAGGVAHNFRNVLQAIMGNSQFLQIAYSQDERLQEITGVINESVKKGSDFVDSLLKFSRQDLGEEILPFDLRDVLDETYKIITNTFDKRIEIVKKIEGPLPIKGDYLNISQVFMNLCNNARDSMPDGGELKIEAMRDNEKVVVAISDTGRGMDEETVKNIFDPFFTTKDIGEGTGLGLSIAHGIVKDHNGEISVSSQPGKGTTFRVSFPVSQESDQSKSESPLKVKPRKGGKILIVDDEPDVLDALENMVKTIGYEADSVGGGNEAIEHYKAHKPELVLLDWKMPNMDGITCAKKILEVDPDARIVMITGYQETSENSINAGLKKMLKDVVLKPCDLSKLDKIISKTLSS